MKEYGEQKSSGQETSDGREPKDLEKNASQEAPLDEVGLSDSSLGELLREDRERQWAELLGDESTPRPDPDTLAEGFRSPHKEFRAAENDARGEIVKGKLDAAMSLDEKSTPLDMLKAHLDVSEKIPENPLGDTFTKEFRGEWGKHPFSEKREK